MNHYYKADLIDEEKADPAEGTSARFLNVPLVLMSVFLGFGVSYLWLRTDAVDFRKGDSRTAASLTPVASSGDALKLGEQLYKKNCQACHQAGGGGLAGAFPPLDGSEWVNGDPETLSAILLHGISGELEVKGQTYKGVMPPFKKKLSPPEMAALATYVRGSWSNSSSAVEAGVVEKIAAATADQASPWKGGAELKEQPWK